MQADSVRNYCNLQDLNYCAWIHEQITKGSEKNVSPGYWIHSTYDVFWYHSLISKIVQKKAIHVFKENIREIFYQSQPRLTADLNLINHQSGGSKGLQHQKYFECNLRADIWIVCNQDILCFYSKVHGRRYAMLYTGRPLFSSLRNTGIHGYSLLVTKVTTTKLNG